jgi:hypothetical protein
MLGVRLNRLISVFIVGGLLLSTSVSQTKLQPKRKTKNFGSSLKRMKWDERKNETVLVPATRHASGDADLDVVRIELP